MYGKNCQRSARVSRSLIVTLVLILIMIVSGTQSLFARDNAFVEKVTIVPSFGFRHIDNGYSPSMDKTGFGPGIEVSYDRFVSPELSFGVSMSAEHFFFKDYFRFTDIKASANLKFQLLPLDAGDSKVRLFFCAGVGADFVFRSDAEFATFFMLRPGLQLNVSGKDGRDFVVSLWSALNLKDEQMVFHGSIGIGLAFAFGEPKRSGGAEKANGPDAVVAPAVEPVAETSADVELPPVVLPEAKPEPAAEEPAAEPAAEEPVAEPVVEEPVAEPEVEVAAEPEKAAVKEVAMRPFHTEKISYIADSVEVDEVSYYTVGEVNIEKHRIYTKDIVVTRTVVVWD